ncbi:SDR family oxidoreductase [Spirosoma harenae]
MKVTLITGASGGIGEAFARRLANDKHNLVLVARSEDKLKALCQQLNTQYAISAQYIAVDLAKAGSDQLIADEIAKRGLEVNWLINNAGIGTGGDFLEYSLEEYWNMMHLNMDAMVALTYRFLPQMRARKRGTIINVGSMASFGAIPYMNIYAATKGFVKYFTEALWEENRPYNIQTMLLCPGATETGFFDAAKIGSDRKSSFSTRNMETPEQVVESAMRGLENGSIVTISGFQNKLSRFFLPLIPTRFGLKFWGDMMRKNLKLSIS